MDAVHLVLVFWVSMGANKSGCNIYIVMNELETKYKDKTPHKTTVYSKKAINVWGWFIYNVRTDILEDPKDRNKKKVCFKKNM